MGSQQVVVTTQNILFLLLLRQVLWKNFMAAKYFLAVEEFAGKYSLEQLVILHCHLCTSTVVVPHKIRLSRILYACSLDSVFATRRKLNAYETCVAIHNQGDSFQASSQ